MTDGPVGDPGRGDEPSPTGDDRRPGPGRLAATARRATARGRGLATMGGSVLDQALSSATQLLVLLFVAHAGTAAEFGTASAVLLAYGLLLGLQRAGMGDVALLRCRRPGTDVLDASRAALGVAALYAVVVAAVLIGTGLAVGGTGGALLLVVGAAAPATGTQDMVRSLAFGRRRVGWAVEVDAIWLTVQVAASSLLVVRDAATPTNLLACWAGGALAGAVWGLLRVRARPSVVAARRWWREDRARAQAFVVDYMSDTGATMLANLGLGLVVGPATFGVLRLAIAAVMPPVNLMASVRALVLGRIGENEHRPRQAARVARGAAAGFATLAVAYGIALVAVPTALGERAFGPTWADARNVALVYAVGEAVRFSSIPAIDLVRVLGRPRVLISTRLAVTTLTVVATLGGGWAFGLDVVWVLLVARGVGAAAWWWRAHQVTRVPPGATGTGGVTARSDAGPRPSRSTGALT